MPRPIALLLLLTATAIWGFAFVAQKSAMDHMGPLTFAGVRYLVGGLATLPFGLLEWTRARSRPLSAGHGRLTRHQWLLIGLLSLVFFGASWLQQEGLRHTTITNAGFLTALYVLFVPVIALIASRTAPHPIIAIAAPMALFGIFLLNGGRLDTLNFGDILMIVGAVLWASQVYLIGYLARGTGLPVFVSALSFLAVGILSSAAAFALEAPTLPAIAAGWVEIAYAGLLSTAIAYTLQAIGQQNVPPSNAAIVLSAESLFAALAGALLFGERLVALGYLGATMIFAAIVLAEIVPVLSARKPAISSDA